MASLPRPKPSSSLSSQRLLKGALFACTLGVFAAEARAQILFSIDYRGPSVGPVACAPGFRGPGDVLSVAPPAACAADMPAYGPLPFPDVVVPGGPGGLGVASIGGCIGAPPGAACPRELDALSTGRDPFPIQGQLPAGFYVFSVDEWAVGIPGSPLFPNVLSEAPVGDSAGDVFEAGSIPPYPMPFPPPIAALPGNTGLVDGNGLVSPTTAHYPGVGLIEPRIPVAGCGPRPGDNLDALDLDVGPIAVGVGYFFSLDAGFFDPLYGCPNLGTAAANGFMPGAILQTPAPGAAPVVYAPPPLLGLDLAGPGTDDLDALALFENGIPGYQPSPAAYVWGAGAPDMVLFSVRRGSAVIGAIASGPIPIPIEAGDILIPPAGPGLPPQIFVPAEYLGLATARMGFAPPGLGDDLDALDTRRPPATAVGFCHGDGSSIACPCGNNGAPGNGCANSAFPAGASLVATGNAQVSADTVSLVASNMTGASCIFFQGSAATTPVVIDDGIGCIGGVLIRFGIKPVAGASSTYPTGADPIVSVKGMLPPAGGTRFYQCFYRNAVAAFCPPATSNRTNGIAILWAP